MVKVRVKEEYEAIQLTESNLESVLDFIGRDKVEQQVDVTGSGLDFYLFVSVANKIWIARIGDWIVKVRGIGLRVYHPRVFEKAYEIVDV